MCASKKRPRPGAASATAFSADELARMEAAKVESGTRTPREVLDALAPTPLRVGDIVLRPLAWADFMVLEQLESPFADSSISGEADVSQLDIALAVYLLTRPTLEVRDLLATEGRAGLERVAFEFAARIPFQDVTALGLKFRETFARAFASIVEGGQKKTATPSAPRPATGSAGA